MAQAVRYVTKRNGVFQYRRRVPGEISRSAARFAVFGSKELFRRSLKTREQSEAYAAADVAHREFESLLAAAKGSSGPSLTIGVDMERLEAQPAPAPMPRGATSLRVGAKGLSMVGAVQRYLEDKKLPPKTVSEVRLTLRIFEEVIGDQPIDGLSRDDFRTFVQYLSGLTVGKRAGSVSRPMAAGTIKKRLGFLRSAINHAEEMGFFDGRNPAADFKVKNFAEKRDPAKTPKKRSFRIDELNQIFKHPWFVGCASPSQSHAAGSHRLRGSEYWVPVVALFSGARASELGGLKLSEVRLDDLHPHFVIRDNEYRPTKGATDDLCLS